MNNSLVTSLVSSDKSVDDQRHFVTLEPVIQVETVSQATLTDIYRMFMRAMAGIPASTYRADGCPIVFDGDNVQITLDFFAWPSSQDLNFELSTSIGEIGATEVVEAERDLDILLAMKNYYDLDFMAISNDPLYWQTPCYNSDGLQVESPQLILNSNRISFPQSLFGVARLHAVAWGYKYQLVIKVTKGDNRLTGLVPVITAAWQDAEGKTKTEHLELTLPPCVEFALNLCAGDIGNTYCSKQARTINAYYSTCSGKIIAVIPGPDPESYCSDIAI